MAYDWLGQSERMERLRLAAPEQSTKTFEASAQESSQDRLKAQSEDMRNLLFHVVAWQYFPKAVFSQLFTEEM